MLILGAVGVGVFLSYKVFKDFEATRRAQLYVQQGRDWIDKCSRFYGQHKSGVRDAEKAFVGGDTRLLSIWVGDVAQEELVLGYHGNPNKVDHKTFELSPNVLPITGDTLFRPGCSVYRYIEDFNLTMLRLRGERRIGQLDEADYKRTK